jgi:hypothetical protein
MEEHALSERLITEFGYPPKGAALVAAKLARLAPPVAAAFAGWWQTGTLPDLMVAGYSLLRLMDEHHMQPIAAFLTLDWLSRDPAAAGASLRKGHDVVRDSGS